MKLKQKLLVNTPILLVELLTVILLVYIAYAEVNRTIPKFQLETLTANLRTQASALSNHLTAGLPLDQFIGFDALSRAVMDSSKHNELNAVIDAEGQVVFKNSRQVTTEQHSLTPMEGFSKDGLVYMQLDQSYRLSIPLENKFGVVGSLVLQTNKAISREVTQRFLKKIALNCSIVFLLFVISLTAYSLLSDKYPKLAEKKKSVINVMYQGSFILITVIVAVSVYVTYEQAASAKTQAVSNVFAQRLESLIDMGIQIEDISGINEELRTYKENNPDISSMAIIHNQTISFHTDENSIGLNYQLPEEHIEYRKHLKGKNNEGWQLVVNVPTDVINDEILRRAKEFFVLFLACGLISWVFLDAGNSLSERIQQKNSTTDCSKETHCSWGLKLVKPAYFLIVFTSALPISFLPNMVSDIAPQAESSFVNATLPFSIFYIVFALVLIPAGSYAERGNLNKMMIIGFITELMGLLLIAFTNDFWVLTLGRAFSGFGQGIFLIGLNTYTLSITPPNKRTEGAAVKVNGRNAALISGTAIGALLFTYMSYQNVFALAAAISVIGIFYVWYLVPHSGEQQDLTKENNAQNIKKEKVSLVKNITTAIRDIEFMKTLLLIGLLGKISIAGVTMFAIPLVLAQKGYSPEVIGQALMLFYISSIIVTSYSSKLVDYSGDSKSILFVSAVIGGMGMFLIGIIDINEWPYDMAFPGFEYLIHASLLFNTWTVQFQYIPEFSTILTLLGIIITGASNGLLAAPIMTHIDKTAVAKQQGSKSVATTYIFLERGGHIVGPIVASQLLLLTHNTTLGIALFGLVTLLFGLFFFILSKR